VPNEVEVGAAPVVDGVVLGLELQAVSPIGPARRTPTTHDRNFGRRDLSPVFSIIYTIPDSSHAPEIIIASYDLRQKGESSGDLPPTTKWVTASDMAARRWSYGRRRIRPEVLGREGQAIYATVSGPGRTVEEYRAIEAPLDAIRSARNAAAKAAFPWADYWYETDTDQFFLTIRDRMTDEDARQIRVRIGIHPPSHCGMGVRGLAPYLASGLDYARTSRSWPQNLQRGRSPPF
jgi:hypothetical protein